jgi:hypothetical protein
VGATPGRSIHGELFKVLSYEIYGLMVGVLDVCDFRWCSKWIAFLDSQLLAGCLAVCLDLCTQGAAAMRV